jgi:hypothetical protein
MNGEGSDNEAISAGESGQAAEGGGRDAAVAPEVIIGEIPDEHDITKMLWTARCSLHGLLGSVETREGAELLRERHLLAH